MTESAQCRVSLRFERFRMQCNADMQWLYRYGTVHSTSLSHWCSDWLAPSHNSSIISQPRSKTKQCTGHTTGASHGHARMRLTWEIGGVSVWCEAWWCGVDSVPWARLCLRFVLDNSVILSAICRSRKYRASAVQHLPCGVLWWSVCGAKDLLWACCMVWFSCLSHGLHVPTCTPRNSMSSVVITVSARTLG